MNMLQVSPIEQ